MKYAFIIDGMSLAIALKHYPDDIRFVCRNVVTVLCCRMSPLQKAQVYMIENTKISKHLMQAEKWLLALSSHLSGCFWGFFCPKILGGGGDLRMVLCHSMNAGSVVGIPWGGGDTRTLSYTKKLVWTFCTHRRPSHLVKLSLSILA